MKIIIRALLSLYFLAFMAGPAFAADEKVTVKPTAALSVDVLSNYMVKGMQYSRNSIVIQPSLTVEYYGFSVNMWGNLDTNPYKSNTWSSATANSSGNWTETDLTLAYDRSFGLINGGIACLYYGNAASNVGRPDFRDQHEALIKVGMNVFLSPTLKIYYMFGDALDKRWYFNLGVSHKFALSKIVALNLNATAGYNIC